MSAKETITRDELLIPIKRTSKAFYIFFVVLLIGFGSFLFAYYQQLTQGLIVTGMRDIPGGSPYGIYLSTFVFWIGLSHAGIAISAAVRLLNLEQYRAVARMAELVTLFSLPMAFLCIIFDIGRPDRVVHLFQYGRWQSPLLWDMTAITTYFMGTAIYLYLSLRPDISYCAMKIRRVSFLKRILYNLLSMGYKPSAAERKKHTMALWWLAVAIVPIMVTVHTVVSWVFGLTMARPGWYSTIFGIYFVLGAILSGIAVVYTLAYIFRWLYRWDKCITDDILRGLAWALRCVFIVYIYLWIQETLTVGFMGPAAEVRVLEFVWFGPYAPIFWSMLTFTFVLPGVILLAPIFKREWFKPGLVFIATLLLNIGLWVKRVVIVVPSLLEPRLYPTGTYIPTVTEISIMLGTFWMFILAYTLFIKFFPVVELDVAGERHG